MMTVHLEGTFLGVPGTLILRSAGNTMVITVEKRGPNNGEAEAVSLSVDKLDLIKALGLL